jgi:hypothetical protein
VSKRGASIIIEFVLYTAEFGNCWDDLPTKPSECHHQHQIRSGFALSLDQYYL